MQIASGSLAQLVTRLDDASARVAVMGLGYVGLPLVEALIDSGFSVIGLDVDPEKLTAIRTGRIENYGVRMDTLHHALQNERLTLTTDDAVLRHADIVVICVPTPLSKTRDPDLSYIVEATRTVGQHLHPSMLVILESTTFPGTTRESVWPMLERSGLRVGVDYALAYSPERIDPGNPEYGLRNTPKVVSGMTPTCRAIAVRFYQKFVEHVVPVSVPEVAEMTKLLENIFRAINIGLVNELAVVCERLGIDVWEVIDAASTKPFGFMKFYPGPGLGGHCIPIDPLYLSWRARQFNTMVRFIDLADSVNRQMPEHVAWQILRCMNEAARAIRGSRILLLGITYKPDVPDIRESPAYEIAQLLLEWGADLTFHDPYIANWTVRATPIPRLAIDVPNGPAWRVLETFDLVVVITDHHWYDYPTLVTYSRQIYDCRNAFQRRGIRPRTPGQIWKLGAPVVGDTRWKGTGA